MRNQKQLHNIKALKTNRNNLRRNLTPAEAALWKVLKNSQLDGRKFRRQYSIGKYILDFYCTEEKLAIELDGAPHFNYGTALNDSERTVYLESLGIQVLRFENKYVFDSSDHVLNSIRNCFKK